MVIPQTKFIMAMVAELGLFVSVAMKWISDDVFLAALIATVGSYMAGNVVAQKIGGEHGAKT